MAFDLAPPLPGPALLAGLGAGAAGSLTIMATTRLEAVLRGQERGPIDYEESHVPLAVVEGVTGGRPRRRTTRSLANGALRLGYGTASGAGRCLLERARPSPPVAVATFLAATWTTEVVGLRVLGAAPPPWRWRRQVLVTSLLQHLVHAVVVEAAYRRLRERQRPTAA